MRGYPMDIPRQDRDVKTGQAIERLVEQALQAQPGRARAGGPTDPPGLREEDFERMASAFGLGSGRTAERLGSPRH
jgi:hypothetical protein